MSYPYIDWAFSQNCKNFKSTLYNWYENNSKQLEYQNSLFKYLKDNQCKNVQEKLANINCIYNYKNLFFELEIAKVLIKNGKKVEMSLNDPPDIYAIDPIFNKTNVEVTTMTDENTEIQIKKYMDDKIKREKIPFEIWVDLNEENSIPVFEKERDNKRCKICKGLEEFSYKYSEIDKNQSLLKISTSVGLFKLKKSKQNIGSFKGIGMGSGIPNNNIIQIIQNKIISKSKDYCKFSKNDRTNLYIIAIYFEDIKICNWHLEKALFGINTDLDIIMHDKIIQAKKRGWENYLDEMKIDEINEYCDGLYLTSSHVKHVSGVIGICRGQSFLYPNPFVFDEINKPELINYL